MIAMTLFPFLTILIVSLVAAAVLHFVVRYRVLSGIDGFLGKWITGWIGGWLGSPVLGHWAFHIGGVYLIPALIGAFAGAFFVTALLKASAGATAAALTAPQSAGPVGMRKVG